MILYSMHLIAHLFHMDEIVFRYNILACNLANTFCSYIESHYLYHQVIIFSDIYIHTYVCEKFAEKIFSFFRMLIFIFSSTIRSSIRIMLLRLFPCYGTSHWDATLDALIRMWCTTVTMSLTLFYSDHRLEPYTY